MHQPLIPRVAYFCMEYGLTEDLPIYAGGLGILAGDYIKAAGDLRLPLTAIGILWSEGYTVQRIGPDGVPYDQYPPTPRAALVPTDARISVRVRGKDVPLTAWRVTLPSVAALYLLEPTEDADRWLTRRLYGGGSDDRLGQEIILGVGGIRLLRSLGIEVDLYHFNEGHAVFGGLELIRERMSAGLSFARARSEVRNQVIFTTHTPVVAGNESHDVAMLVEQGADLGVFTDEQLVEIGGDPFGMTVAGLRLSAVANAVAELHGETSRRMWRNIADAAPIVAITNGVHPHTWQDARIRVGYAHGTLWEMHQLCKRELLGEVRRRTGVLLDEDRLLIGFARRAAAYKRSDLLLRDPDVIGPYLASRGVQLVFSGKAHPHDRDGKRIVSNLVAMASRYPQSIVFLENYDMGVARLMVRGCDIWLNNPRRPMEASGTSGMKAAMNGALNVSILDGWWPEGCIHGVNGWQIGDGFEGPGQDEHDLAALYKVLLGEVVPTYYNDRPRWIAMMRHAIEMSQWQFSTHRMIEDYYRKLYRSPRAGFRSAPDAKGVPGDTKAAS
jgi:glycogen phosphorylase